MVGTTTESSNTEIGMSDLSGVEVKKNLSFDS